MKLANKIYSAMLVLICFVLAACSGVPGGSSGSGSGSGGELDAAFVQFAPAVVLRPLQQIQSGLGVILGELKLARHLGDFRERKAAP